MEKWLLESINIIVIVSDEVGNIVYTNKDISFLKDSKCKIINGISYVEIGDDIFSVQEKHSIFQNRKYVIQTLYCITKETNFLNELKGKVYIDALTEILNRDGFEYEYVELLKRSSEFSVVMCDIDNFKIINDNYGHLLGDEVLKHVSRVLRDNFRKDDPIARYGGDEFIILLKDYDIQNIKSRLVKVQDDLNNFSLIPITIKMSFGFAKNDINISMNDNISNADKALYYSKNNGKGIITCCEELIKKIKS